MSTKLENIVNPQVMGDMINAKIEAMLKITPYAKVDTSLQGVAGDTKTVPAWNYIGDAEEIAEGGEISLTAMSAGTKTFKIKKAMKSVGLSEEAILSGLGNPIGQAERQLALSIASKVDNDILEALLTSTHTSGDGSAKIAYSGIVDGVGVFEEEEITEKVMFIAPEQVTTLRKDSDFISADKYGNNVMMTGEIGTVAGVHIVPTRKIKADESNIYSCPIVKLEAVNENTEYTEDELPAVTIFLKKDTTIGAEFKNRTQTHEITAAKYYGVALTNEAKVVIAKFKK